MGKPYSVSFLTKLYAPQHHMKASGVAAVLRAYAHKRGKKKPLTLTLHEARNALSHGRKGWKRKPPFEPVLTAPCAICFQTTLECLMDGRVICAHCGAEYDAFEAGDQ